MVTRAERVMQESREVRDLLYGDGNTCNKVTDCLCKQYISDNKGNEAVLDRVLSEKGIKLLIAPPSTGKTTSLVARAKELVAAGGYRVIFCLPTRGLALQIGQIDGIEAMVGGDLFNDNAPLIATTYEKMFAAEGSILYPQAGAPKTVLVLDECHLFTTQHTFREDAIKRVIKLIEKGGFHSIVLVTATPEPMSLFHCDEIVSVQRGGIPNITKLEILEVDDPVEYIISGIDYDKEFPFIRLNNIGTIDSLISQMPLQMAKVTGDDRLGEVYRSIVEKGKISSTLKNGTKLNGILATSVIEAGVSITKYPANTVPIAVFPDGNISTDDVEQFLNRIRAKRQGRSPIKCARVIIRKPAEREIKAELFPIGSGNANDGAICTFHDVRIEKGDAIIADTGQMDSVGDGEYRIRFQIGKGIFDRYITVASSGKTDGSQFSKQDASPMIFQGIGFRSFLDILKGNLDVYDRISDAEKELETHYEQKRQGLSGAALDAALMKDEVFIKQIISGFIREAGEQGECISFKDGKVSIDKRICYENSYKQYQRQYYGSHDLLADELHFRLGADVEIKEFDTQKWKKPAAVKEELWDGIEPLRDEIAGGGDNDMLWDYIMRKRGGKYLWTYSRRVTVAEVWDQPHLMKILKELEKDGITGAEALCILTSSRTQKKINEYVRCFHLIAYNKMLNGYGSVDISSVPTYKGKKRESMLQAAVHCWLKKQNTQTTTITKQLVESIRDFYKDSYKKEKKIPTPLSIRRKMRMMYESDGVNSIDKTLRINLKSIFSLVKPDYAAKKP